MSTLALAIFQREEYTVQSTHPEVFLVVEMCVESRTAHVCSMNDFLYRQFLKTLRRLPTIISLRRYGIRNKEHDFR